MRVLSIACMLVGLATGIWAAARGVSNLASLLALGYGAVLYLTTTPETDNLPTNDGEAR